MAILNRPGGTSQSKAHNNVSKQIDYETLVRIVTEEVMRYLQEQNAKPAATPAEASACGCPLPAVNGGSTADPVASCPTPVVQPSGNEALAAIPPAIPAKPFKRVLCLFTGANEGFDVFLKTAEAWAAQGVALDGVYSESAKSILPMQRLSALGIREIADGSAFGHHFEGLKQYDMILLPTLSRTYVAKMALGITDNLVLNLAYTALAYGLKMMGSTDGLAPSACPVCANHLPGIPELLDEYQARIRRMGVQLFPMRRLVAMAGTMILGVGTVAADTGTEVITQLITQHEAAQLPGPVVRVSRGGLVTPSAKDVLSQRGIEIEVVSKS